MFFIPKLILTRLDYWIKIICLLISLFAIIAIVIAMKGSFLGYIPTHYTRISSIFFDPNYFGTMCAIGIIICLYNQDKKFKFLALLNFIALYYSGSRGAMISLLLTLALLFLYKKKINIGDFSLLICAGFMIYGLIHYLEYINYFRIYQGFSGREYLWIISKELFLREPLFGYGYGGVQSVFIAAGASNISSHNAYLDYILTYGILAFLIYIIVIMKAIYFGLKHNVPKYLIGSIILLLINANSISINIGGLGALSLLFTLFLGSCNSYGDYNHNSQIKPLQSEKNLLNG